MVQKLVVLAFVTLTAELDSLHFSQSSKKQGYGHVRRAPETCEPRVDRDLARPSNEIVHGISQSAGSVGHWSEKVAGLKVHLEGCQVGAQIL